MRAIAEALEISVGSVHGMLIVDQSVLRVSPRRISLSLLGVGMT